MLRIEDTDQERFVPGAAKELERILSWVGVNPDESPLVGGQYGPYFQSERLSLYTEHVQSLLDKGLAYRCFCSNKRLELLKKEAARARQPNKYDRKCLEMPESELQNRLDRGDAYTVRFLLTPHPESFNDLVYGDITHDVFQLEGDPIIMKSDGFPTYHFANVVDDHLMAVSHVLRGVEWQASTPKHILLYRALGWTPPKFGHLPLIINSDGTKLSKRQGDLHLDTLRRAGNFPEAIINFVTLMGGGFEDKEYSLDTFHSLESLCQKFDLSKVRTNASKLEMERLDLVNKAVLKNMLEDERSRKQLVLKCWEMVEEALDSRGLVSDCLDSDTVERHLMWAAQDRISKLSDIVSEKLIFLWSIPKYSEQVKISKAVITDVHRLMSEIETVDKTVIKTLKTICSKENIKFSILMTDLRLLLTGQTEGPPVLELLQILGISTVCRRLERFINS